MEAAQPSHPSANNDVIKGSNSENELDPKIPCSSIGSKAIDGTLYDYVG